MPDPKPRNLLKNMKVLARTRTPYNDILVTQFGLLLEMWFLGEGQFFLQSRVDVEDPRSLQLVYSRMILAALLFRPRPRRVLIIGLGGGAVSNWLHAGFPQAEIDVVEIDPQVIRFARKYFFVQEAPGYRIHQQDGRVFVAEQLKRGVAYDIIFLDAFKSGSIPYHLKTAEFYQNLRAVLSAEGVAASNLYGKSNKLKPRDRETFLSIFPQVYLFEDTDKVATVSIATQQQVRWTHDQFRRQGAAFPSPPGMSLPMESVAASLQEPQRHAQGGRVFRDDFPAGKFAGAVERHNLQRGASPPYPISNVS
ncbi:MAG: spermidine synthase [Nitrospinaceae bacterium]